jgi:hypothetical protein
VAVSRQMSSAAKQIDLESGVALQEARTWDEGVSSEFSTTPLSEIFKVIDCPFSPVSVLGRVTF